MNMNKLTILASLLATSSALPSYSNIVKSANDDEAKAEESKEEFLARVNAEETEEDEEDQENQAPEEPVDPEPEATGTSEGDAEPEAGLEENSVDAMLDNAMIAAQDLKSEETQTDEAAK